MREQPISLIELFYDLIYMYVIAKMTPIFHGKAVWHAGMAAISVARDLRTRLPPTSYTMSFSSIVDLVGQQLGLAEPQCKSLYLVRYDTFPYSNAPVATKKTPETEVAADSGDNDGKYWF